MFCKNCGSEIADDSVFCPKCGASAKEGAVPATKESSKPSVNVWKSFTKTMNSFYHWVIDGRCSRSKFWSFELFFFIAIVICTLLDRLLFYGLSNTFTTTLTSIVGIVEIKLWCGRIHDTGKPWAYIFIPFYNIILTFFKSEEGENKYGKVED